MDLRCVNCGEPWDMDYVLHDAPNDFKRTGGVINHCPSCPKDGSVPKLDKKERAKLAMIESFGEVLGNDIDAFAAGLEEFDLL